jgi:CRP-like cAMP-binding protein
MNKTPMIEKLQPILPSDRIEEFLALGKERKLSALDCFIRVQEVPVKIAFVKEGLFRYLYVNEKGDEFTKGIITESNFLSSYSAMVQQKPSFFAIEALEDSILFEIQWIDIAPLFEKDLFWSRFLLRFLEKGFMVKEKRERDFLLLDAETRYKNFLTDFPGIDQRIKQSIIASYLGIQPETLSRIRKKVAF